MIIPWEGENCRSQNSGGNGLGLGEIAPHGARGFIPVLPVNWQQWLSIDADITFAPIGSRHRERQRRYQESTQEISHHAPIFLPMYPRTARFGLCSIRKCILPGPGV